MLFLSLKYMHSIDNAVYTLLNMIHAASYWVWNYNGLCKKINNCVCGIITRKYGKNLQNWIFLSEGKWSQGAEN